MTPRARKGAIATSAVQVVTALTLDLASHLDSL